MRVPSPYIIMVAVLILFHCCNKTCSTQLTANGACLYTQAHRVHAPVYSRLRGPRGSASHQHHGLAAQAYNMPIDPTVPPGTPWHARAMQELFCALVTETTRWVNHITSCVVYFLTHSRGSQSSYSSTSPQYSHTLFRVQLSSVNKLALILPKISPPFTPPLFPVVLVY